MPVVHDAGEINRPDHRTGVERIDIRRAAIVARHRYPGPVGELIARELAAWEDFGYRFGDQQLIARLVADLT